MIEFNVCLLLFLKYLINIGWIRIRMDPELLPGSGSGTRKIQSWIRIRNKSFRIHQHCRKVFEIILLIFLLSKKMTSNLPDIFPTKNKKNWINYCLLSLILYAVIKHFFLIGGKIPLSAKSFLTVSFSTCTETAFLLKVQPKIYILESSISATFLMGWYPVRQAASAGPHFQFLYR